jgi:hypothetical protein
MQTLKIQKSLPGVLESELYYFEKIKGFEYSSFKISNEIMIIYFKNGIIEDYPLTFLENEYPMLVRRGLFKDGKPFRVITSELDPTILTIGSLIGIGYAINFKLIQSNTSSFDSPKYKTDINEYIEQFKEQLTMFKNKYGNVLLSNFEEMVINWACYEILLLRRDGLFDKQIETQIINTVTEAASKLLLSYNDSHKTIAKSQIMMNCDWEGMWEHLKKYYMRHFNTPI